MDTVHYSGQFLMKNRICLTLADVHYSGQFFDEESHLFNTSWCPLYWSVFLMKNRICEIKSHHFKDD